MKNFTLILIVLFILAGIVVLGNGNKAPENNDAIVATPEGTALRGAEGSDVMDTAGGGDDVILGGPEETEPATGAGIYTDYDPALLANADDGDVVIFFKADWCPTCNAFERDVIANADQIPADLTILKTDYDTSTVLKEKYGITYQHTYVQVDSQGKELTKWQGSTKLNQFLEKVI